MLKTIRTNTEFIGIYRVFDINSQQHKCRQDPFHGGGWSRGGGVTIYIYIYIYIYIEAIIRVMIVYMYILAIIKASVLHTKLTRPCLPFPFGCEGPGCAVSTRPGCAGMPLQSPEKKAPGLFS